jgi:hypothetical protein
MLVILRIDRDAGMSHARNSNICMVRREPFPWSKQPVEEFRLLWAALTKEQAKRF